MLGKPFLLIHKVWRPKYSLLIFEDMCRCSLPTSDAPRLPPYILRRMPQGMVRLPSFAVDQFELEYMSILSRHRSRYKTRRQSQHSAGLVASGESEAWKNRARKGRREEEVQAGRQRTAKITSSTRFRVVRGQKANYGHKGAELARSRGTEKQSRQTQS